MTTIEQQADFTSQAAMMQMVNGKCVSRCVSLVAELGIADLLADGPRDVASIARATNSNPDALYRVLRMLAALGIFVELANEQFQNSNLSETLSSKSGASIRNYARWFGRELHWRFWTDLEYSVQTGSPSVFKNHPGKMPFELLADHPADQETFNEAMTELSAVHGAAIVQAYDFSQFGRIVEVGGGQGTLARLIAQRNPACKVTVLDLPHVIDGVANRPSDNGSMERIDFKSGSFFEEVPGPADLCVLKHILHDWDDKSAHRILENCRQALSDRGRVLVCEMLVAEGPEGLPALILDIEMLVGAGGRERTEREFSELFAAVGLRLNRIIQTHTPIKLLEAVPIG